MRYSISDTAQFGDMTRGPRIVNENTKAEMRKILDEIRGGSFAKEWILENKANRPQFNALARRDQDHLIEQVGAELRAMMSWVQRPQGVQAAAEAQSAEQQTVGTGGRKIEL
jgi:ketol-acid reductoisomerase